MIQEVPLQLSNPTPARLTVAPGAGAFRSVHSVGTPGTEMFFDPGTRQTMISDAVANALGLTTPLLDDCGTGVFRVDSIALAGPGGRYVVSDAIVCRNDAGMAQVGGGHPPERSEAIIGARLFRRMAIVVDGPGNRLGILRP